MKPRVAVVALAAVVVAAGSASLFRSGYSPDEEFTLFAVRGIHAHGVPLLPSGLLYDRGLLFSYLSWLGTLLTGLELPAFRALGLLSAAGALVVGHALVRRLASPAAAALAALLVATSAPFWAVATTGRFYAPFLLTCLAVGTVLAHLPSQARAGPHPPASARTWLALAALALLSRLTHELAFTLAAVPLVGLAASWLARGGADPPRDLRPSAPLADLRHLRPSAPLADRRHLRHLRPFERLRHLRPFERLRHLRPFERLRHLRPLRRLRHLRPWLDCGVALGAGLAAAQVLLFALHSVQPRGEGGDMIQRFFLWQVLNLFERPRGAPLGVVGAALVVAWLLVPARAVTSLLLGAGVAAAVLAVALAQAVASAPLSMSLVQSVAAGGLAYPLDMFWHLAGTHPVMVWTAITLLVARLAGAGGEWSAGERAAHLGWVGWVLWFGVIESGITVNYVLLPTVCLLGAIGIDLVAIGQQAAAVWPGRRGQLIRAALAGAALVVVTDQWPGPGTLPDRLAEVRPTIDVAGIEAVRNGLQPTDRVACTDELACLLLVGRVDYWLALHEYVRERFLVMRGSQVVGVYAGSPAAFRPADLFEPGADGRPPGRVIVVDVFKDYAVGDSAAWLPRAMEEDRIGFQTLLLTPQARVLVLQRQLSEW